jgi:hypothetical protein
MKWLAIIVSIVVAAALIAGFMVVGSPAKQRLVRFDERKINDLQMIQSQVMYYWQQKGELPKDLASLSASAAPVDPQNGSVYEYVVKSNLSFDLCANFNLASTTLNNNPTPAPVLYGDKPYYANWDHTSGRVCFNRVIDPQLDKGPVAPR